MKIITLLLAASLNAIALPPFAARAWGRAGKPEGIRRHERVVPGSYIVVLKDDVAAGRVRALAEQLSQAHGGQLTATYRHALKGFSAQLGERAAEALSRHPLVAYVEEDAVVELAATQTNAPWGLDRIDQRDLPLSDTYTYANSGAGAHVYVIDSGIRTTHEEFEGRAGVAFDNVGDGQNGEDCFGHGTHVASVVGGKTYGAAKGAQLHAVRVFNCSNTSTLTKVIGGIDFVTSDHQTPAVAVLSLSTTASSSLDTAVGNSISAGVTYAVAAGNNNIDAGTRSPSRVSAAITVGATDAADVRATFSNFGAALDLFAPGVDIEGASIFDDTSMILRSGTSMAAAHAAGVAARYLSANQGEAPATVSEALTSNATLNRVSNEGTGSPDRLLYRPASKLAYDYGEIYTMNFNGSSLAALTDTGRNSGPAWSPDGTKIAFESYRDGNWEIYLMNADGSGLTRLTNNSSYDLNPSWSPGGDKIIFDSERDGDGEIYVMNADGSSVTQLTNNTAGDANPDFSPDGTKVVFVSYRTGTAHIFVMNADGSSQVNLTASAGGGYEPAWSPDGAKIAFSTSRVGGPEIFVMNADGSNPIRLTDSIGENERPDWSVDGERIIFSGFRGSDYDLYVINADGSSEVNLTDTSEVDECYPSWQPL
jgi:Tol biopolymer transport system component